MDWLLDDTRDLTDTCTVELDESRPTGWPSSAYPVTGVQITLTCCLESLLTQPKDGLQRVVTLTLIVHDPGVYLRQDRILTFDGHRYTLTEITPCATQRDLCRVRGVQLA